MTEENQLKKEKKDKINLLFEDLRSGKGIDKDASHDLMAFNNANYIRNLLVKKDLDWIKKLLNSDFDKDKALAVCIIRPLQYNPGIKEDLLSLWDQKDLPFLIRSSLIWRLLDYSDLETKYHEIILNWLRANKEEFKIRQIKWNNGLENIVNNAQSRLDNSDYNDTKKWIYLVEIAWLGGYEIARKIIKTYVGYKIEFVSKVAEDLLIEIDNK